MQISDVTVCAPLKLFEVKSETQPCHVLFGQGHGRFYVHVTIKRTCFTNISWAFWSRDRNVAAGLQHILIETYKLTNYENDKGYLLCICNKYSHSHLSRPLPTNSSKHVHTKLPRVFSHRASRWQGEVSHSLMSLHVVPLPVKPVLQSHLCRKSWKCNAQKRNQTKSHVV